MAEVQSTTREPHAKKQSGTEKKCFFWLKVVQDESQTYAWMETNVLDCCANQKYNCRHLLHRECDKATGKTCFYQCMHESWLDTERGWSTELIVLVVMSCLAFVLISAAVAFYRFKQGQWNNSFTKLSLDKHGSLGVTCLLV